MGIILASFVISLNAIMCAAFAGSADTFLITTSILAGAMILTSGKK